MTTESVWMTATARQRLEQELAELERGIAAGADVDQTRVLEVREMLRAAEVDRKPDDGLVEPGMTITVRFERDGSTDTFLLGRRELHDLDPDVELDVYSPTSPLGSAIAGRYVGDVVEFTAPSGAQRIEIVSAVPFG